MGIDVRGISEDETDDLLRVCFWAFGSQPKPEELEDERTWFEPERGLVAVDDDRFVGSAGAYTFELTVPGGAQVPVAGVTVVGVLPTHRRRGVLNSMMQVQLDDIAERGEPVAVLTASEAGIYGRFGYGMATRLAIVTIDTTRGLPLRADPAPGGRLRLVTDAEIHAELCAPVYDHVRRSRVGELSRPASWWTMIQRDREDGRRGGSARFCVVHEDDAGAIDGFCWYRVKEQERRDDAVARNDVRITELAAADAEIEAALLAYLAAIDLTTSITAERPVDDPWTHRIVDHRRYRINLVHDYLYVRLLDVPAALAARTYEAPGTITLAVDDPFRPKSGGRFRLEVADDGAATCEHLGDRDGDDADLTLDAPALGSLYLGDTAPSVLAAAGRLQAPSAAALATADRVFPTARTPLCTTKF